MLPLLPRFMGRQKGLDFALEYIRAEDLQTNFVCIGPVNKAMNMLISFIHAEAVHGSSDGSGKVFIDAHLSW